VQKMARLDFGVFKRISADLENALYYSNDGRTTSNIYLFHDENGKSLIVDSGDGNDALAFAPHACFLTHGHFDHTGGVKQDWKNVFIHPLEDAHLPFIKIPENANPITSTSFDFGAFHFEIIHTPGHTPGSMCLFETNHSILLSGDTLFVEGHHGRTDISTEDADERMEESLDVLSRVNWKTLCPGHGRLENI